MIINNILFFLSGFMIFWAMVGYPLSILILGKIFVNKKNEKNYSLNPDVTILIVAHNEEKVIKDKLLNVCDIDYPIEKLKILISSDHSSDRTNEIVEEFISNHLDYDIRLYKVKERKGKTNAQNEAQKTVDTKFLVMTDANAMLEKNSIKELLACFTKDDIVYVTGCLKYINSNISETADSETVYWDNDITIRDIESRIQTITAGNGALYACRNSQYIDFDPIECHDASMPLYYALHGKRALNCLEAIAYEKAGENNQDEFKRKVRMNRMILPTLKKTLKTLNLFKYKWFSFFYFGHRYSRYLLWINHLILLITNIFIVKDNIFFLLTFIFQLFIYGIALLQQVIKSKNKIFKLINYYVITVIAQWVGVFNNLTKKTKSTWEKAESTR